jgi:hypothetical protein
VLYIGVLFGTTCSDGANISFRDDDLRYINILSSELSVSKHIAINSSNSGTVSLLAGVPNSLTKEQLNHSTVATTGVIPVTYRRALLSTLLLALYKSYTVYCMCWHTLQISLAQSTWTHIWKHCTFWGRRKLYITVHIASS